MGTQLFLWRVAGFLAALALSSLTIAQQKPNPPAASAQTVFTMGSDYTITPAGVQDDGKHYKLNRRAKDGTIYETVDLTKTGEKAGTTVYTGPNGTYTRNAGDGTLQEPAELHAAQTPATPSPVITPLTLMKETPVVSVARNPTRIESIVLPDGMTASRIDIVEGKHVLLLITGIENGKPHEVAVRPAGVRQEEKFYVRISNPTNPGEPLVYGVMDEKTVNSYAELPQEAPQVETTDAQTPQSAPAVTAAPADLAQRQAGATRLSADAVVYESSRFTPPVELPDRAEDGSRQFSLRIKLTAGITSDITVKPMRGQEDASLPNMFYLQESARQFVVYTVVPSLDPNAGPTLSVLKSVPPETASAVAGQQPVSRGGHKSHTSYTADKNENPLDVKLVGVYSAPVFTLTYEKGKKIQVLPVGGNGKVMQGLQNIAGLAGLSIRVPGKFSYTKFMRAYNDPEAPLYFDLSKGPGNTMIVTGDDDFDKLKNVGKGS